VAHSPEGPEASCTASTAARYRCQVTARSPEDLEQALAAAERRLRELQAWVDSSDAEVEKLRARLGELETSGGAAKVAELGEWLEAAEAEAETLRGRVSEAEARGHAKVVDLQGRLEAAAREEASLHARVLALEATGGAGGAGSSPASDRKSDELQQWLDAAEVEAEQLRARVAELEAQVGAVPAPSTPSAPASDRKSDELQQWLDASEAEVARLTDQLAAKEAEVAKLQQLDQRHSVEAQAWIDSAQEEAEVLRAKVVADEEVVQKEERQVKELEQWLASTEGENEALRVRVDEEGKRAAKDERQAKELQEWLDAAEAEVEGLKAQLAEARPEETKRLKERVAELEASVGSLTEMNRRFSDQAERAAQNEVARLHAELERAKAEGGGEKAEELSALLENAREAIATLEVERRHALAQVQRYASDDSQLATEQERRSQVLRQEKDARIAVLQASLGQREAELKNLEARVVAYASAETQLKEDHERLRVSECEAREQLAHVRDERGALQSEKNILTEKVAKLSEQLEEAKRWLDDAAAENEGLEKKIEADRLAAVMRETEWSAELERARAAAPPPPSRRSLAAEVLPEPESAEGYEGFSVARLKRLESMLAAETLRADNLRRFLTVAEKGLDSLKDQLELAQARLLDMAKRLGLGEGETSETSMRLLDAARELAAIEAELRGALVEPRPPPPPLDAFDEAPPKEEDVLSAPMDAVAALADAQAAAARQATEALEGEQRAKETLLGDLSWLKSQLERVSSARDELRTRLEAMVQRELKRKAVVTSLLDRLRANEAGAAARAGALRRLQAAIELAQRNAVRVQTIYFQKQIGSLQRQLEIALGKKRPPAPGSTRAPVATSPRVAVGVVKGKGR